MGINAAPSLAGPECKYVAFAEQVNYYQAKEDCERRGMALAMVRSKEDEADLMKAIRAYPGFVAWLGATDEGHEGDWRWPNGDGLSYKNWAPGQPDNWHNFEHCMMVFTKFQRAGQWNDVHCKYFRVGYVCQMG